MTTTFTANGIAGIETSLSVALAAHRAGELSLATIVAALTTGPAQLLRCTQPEIASGSPASLVEVDLAATWRPIARHRRICRRSSAVRRPM